MPSQGPRCVDRARRLLTGAALLALSAALGAPTSAQTVTIGQIEYEQFPPAPLEPQFGGFWIGPIDLVNVMNPDLDPRHPTNDDRNWGEITHAVLLPPPTDAPSSDSRRVLLVTRRYDTGTLMAPGGDTPVHTFIWDRAQPTTLTSQILNPDVADGTDELFCGGHALTAGGNVLFVGGTDDKKQLLYGGVFWGHRLTHLFMNQQVPYWIAPPAIVPPEGSPVPDMQRARWYPTAVRVADGSIVVAGHGNYPIEVPDTATTRERCDVDDATGRVTWRSYAGSSLLNNLAGKTCSNGSVMDLQIYPRMHQLLSGELFATLSQTEVLAFDVCTDPTNPDRWKLIHATPALSPAPDAATVHLIDLTPATGPTEVIYALGGVVDGTHTLASDRVLRMNVNIANPATSTWTNVGVPQLKAGRIFLETVILLDGSLFTVGGVSQDPDSLVETYFYYPERYEPPGIFASPSPTPKYMNRHVDERTYHSVAVLLPTGEVFSAGGQGTSVFVDGPDESLSPVPPWDSVEIFQPPYMFATGRPAIQSAPANISLGAQDLQLGVKLHSSSSGGETRVALIGPGSMTHAMDSSQVYIKLKFAPFTPAANPNDVTTIHFDAPPNGNVAPPGWYLLTVVNAAGLPASARWVHVDA